MEVSLPSIRLSKSYLPARRLKPGWIEEIVKSQTTINDVESELVKIDQRIKQEGRTLELRSLQLANNLKRMEAEEKANKLFNSIQPYVTGHVPQTPFGTLLLVMGVVVVMTVIKGGCLVLNTVLVAQIANRTGLVMRRQFYSAALKNGSTGHRSQRHCGHDDHAGPQSESCDSRTDRIVWKRDSRAAENAGLFCHRGLDFLEAIAAGAVDRTVGRTRRQLPFGAHEARRQERAGRDCRRAASHDGIDQRVAW